MKISYDDYGPVTVLTLSGEFTSEDTERFDRTVSDRLTAGARDVILNCEHLEFIDSEGLERWLRLQERAAEGRGRVRLVALDPTVAKILELTRLSTLFQPHDSVESAVKSLR